MRTKSSWGLRWGLMALVLTALPATGSATAPATSFTVSHGIRATVGRCTIVPGDITIDGAVTAAADSDMVFVSLDGDIHVDGQVHGASGSSAPAVDGTGQVIGRAGRDGRSIVLLAPRGAVHVTGLVAAGDGGRGSSVRNEATGPRDAAWAGHGGRGGELSVGAFELAPLDGHVQAGRGGDGGDATLTGQWTTTAAVGGDGGEVGQVRVVDELSLSTAVSEVLRWCDATAHPAMPLYAAGIGSPTLLACTAGSRGGDANNIATARGSDGWNGWNGWDSATYGYRGDDGGPGGNGASAGTATGGNGESGCPGGHGGSANSSAWYTSGGNGGNGGDGGCGTLAGGNGGNGGTGGNGGGGTIARGGDGGYGLSLSGGSGGNAFTSGGSGGHGGHGGWGGDSMVAGGLGGLGGPGGRAGFQGYPDGGAPGGCACSRPGNAGQGYSDSNANGYAGQNGPNRGALSTVAC